MNKEIIRQFVNSKEVREAFTDPIDRIELEQLLISFHENRENTNTEQEVRKFIDKDTGHYVIEVETLNISGYGKTEDQAIEMINFSFNELIRETKLQNKHLTPAEGKPEPIWIGFEEALDRERDHLLELQKKQQ